MSIMVCRMRTVPMPRIITRLEERLPDGGVLPLGEADLTYAAAVDIDAGRRWDTDLVPATVEVCKALSHEARMAAWAGRLHAPGLAEQFARFEEAILAQGRGAFSFRLSVYYAARQVARHAAWLARTVSHATAAPWPEAGYAAHPLTGEAFDVARRHEIESPFAFAVLHLPFVGIDATAIADFLRDGGGGAAEYLSCSVMRPEMWFRGLRDLEEAAMGFVLDGHFEAFADAVRRWNAMQEVVAVTPRFDVIHVDGTDDGHAAAREWASQHLRTASALVEAMREQGDAMLQAAMKKDSS